ncbi:hypothetical protein EWM64_g4980 [Hericium alpestre]|uniref:HAT C-terminal dimerisation domain-containing protein n=1 Tax=Hericium alpestre TaxID=135208 RepID=A0A4Y9ZYB4_9AGAM|nr:hypothetical protein EWM64_g4980 [Hericium alpestre]
MLERFGLQEKILAMNADNASSNDTQTRKLAKMDNSFEEVNRVRCFNHTLQLSAKALLQPFNNTLLGRHADGDAELLETMEDDVPSLSPVDDTEDDSDDEDDDETGADAEADIEVIIEGEDDGIDELDALPTADREKLVADTAEVRTTITKIRQLSFAIIHSTTIALPAWRRMCKDLDLKPRLIPHDVVTRWNSTYDMLKFALDYRTAIDKITAEKNLKMRKYELDDDEWEIISDLVARYKEATLFFLQDTANIAAVIPAMDKLDLGLNPATQKHYHPAIRAAMKLARNKMDRYWNMTDLSSTYRIAMVLHPGLKLQYFRNHHWEDEWIETAENLVREEYAHHYEHENDAVESEINDAVPQTADNTFDFGDISVGNEAERISELEEYLRSPVEKVKDPVQWWFSKRHVYPKLSRMALDYLSIPATSTAVERVFSQGRQLLHFTRNRLSPYSIRAYLCLGSWSRHNIISFEQFLNAATEKKCKRSESKEI